MKNHLWNLLASIKNCQVSKKNKVLQVRKKLSEHLLKVLWNEGYISSYKINLNNKNKVDVYLKYTQKGVPVISSIKILSKPSRKCYYSFKEIVKLDTNQNFIIISTNRGLKTLQECKRLKIGGEPLVEIV